MAGGKTSGQAILQAAVFGTLSIGIAGGAAVGVFQLIGYYQDELSRVIDDRPSEIWVTVAAREVPIGHTIQKEDLAEVPYRSEYVAPTVVLKPELLLGRVARERILAFDLFREERLAPRDSGQDMNAVIAQGMRAESLNLSDGSQVSGFLMPGNRVDVLVTLFSDDGAVAETTTLMQATRVLAVNDRTAEGHERGIKLKPQVTLEVSPEDAEKLTHGVQNGRVRLALRGDVDFEWHETRSATTEMLLGGTETSARLTVTEFYDRAGIAPDAVVQIIHGTDVHEEKATPR